MLRNFYLQAPGGMGTLAHGAQHLGSGKVALFWGGTEKFHSIEIYDNLKEMKRGLGVTEESGTVVVWSGSSDHPAGKGLAREPAA